MTRYIIDAYAWIAYLEGGNPKAKDIIETRENELVTPILVYAEVISKVQRKGMDYRIASEAILSNSTIAYINVELASKAALFHAETRQKVRDFSLPDAFVLATARELNGRILTGDMHFKDFKEAVMI